jgi:hypothetical protein
MSEYMKERWPGLLAYLVEYGLDEKLISNIDRVKGNYDSGYYVVGSLQEDGMIHMIDVSNTPDGMMNSSKGTDHQWNMLNDGMEPVTEAEWKKLKLDPYCETFTIAGHESYGA